LGQIVVTSKRTEIVLGEVTDNVALITEEEIRRLPANDLGEVLRYVSGVDAEPRQGFGRPTSLSIQGSESRQVRVMIDGIPFNPQSSGQVNLSQFPIAALQRIEVVTGSNSSSWGSNLGGVVNMITKNTGRTKMPAGSLTTSFSEFDTQRQNAEVYGKADDARYYSFFSRMDSGGSTDRSDVSENKFLGKADFDLQGTGLVTTLFGYSGAHVNSGIFPDGSWQAQPYTARYAKIGWESDIEDKMLSVDLKYSRQNVSTRTYLSADDTKPFWSAHTEDSLSQLSLNSTLPHGDYNSVVLGADFDWDVVKSDLYIKEAKRVQQAAAYINYCLALEAWTIDFGLRKDSNSEFGGSLSPSLGLVYYADFPPETAFRTSVSRAFDVPPLLWKYNENPLLGVIPNPNLRPERALCYELVAESAPLPDLWVKFSLYRADVSDAIAWAENESLEIFQKNFKKFRRQGAGLQIKMRITETMEIFSSSAFNDIENRITREIVKGGGKPRQSFDVGITYKNQRGLDVTLKGYYDRWNNLPSAQANDRKMIFDMNISKKLGRAIIFLNTYNLTNSSYWSDIYYPLKERYFEGGITLNW